MLLIVEISHREQEKVAEGPLIGRGYLIKGLWWRLAGLLKNRYDKACVKLSVRV